MNTSYNNPNDTDGSGSPAPSSIGPQIRTDYYVKKALVEAAKERHFTPLANTRNMPKHFGKKMKLFHYLPLLDDANINDQGLDATGSPTQTVSVTIRMTPPGASSTGNGYVDLFAVGEVSGTPEVLIASKIDAIAGVPISPGVDGVMGVAAVPAVTGAPAIAASAADALKAAVTKAVKMLEAAGTTITAATFAALKTEAEKLGWTIYAASAAVAASGNLYGSSKDVGTIQGKMPTLNEHGGQVNRVGVSRIEIEGTIQLYGFYNSYTQESVMFDTDAEIEEQTYDILIKGANEITEDLLQIDLLNSAGVVRFGGSATSKLTLSGDLKAAIAASGAGPTAIAAKPAETGDEMNYKALVRMGIDLDNNRCPKQTKIITGSRMIDTRVIKAARYLYIGSELLPTLLEMKDSFGEKAFIEAQHYAAAGTIMNGEEGSVAGFRVIVVPEMMHFAGAGAKPGATAGDFHVSAATGLDAAGAARTGDGYDVFPALVVGDAAFSTIGFQTNGKTVKFKIIHKKPGKEIADMQNPYGLEGFRSIHFYYGFLLERPERIALYLSVAQL